MYHQQYQHNPGAMPGRYMPVPGQLMRSYAPPPQYAQPQVFCLGDSLFLCTRALRPPCSAGRPCACRAVSPGLPAACAAATFLANIALCRAHLTSTQSNRRHPLQGAPDHSSSK